MGFNNTGFDRSCVELFKEQTVFYYLDDHERKLGGCRLPGRENKPGALCTGMAFCGLFYSCCVGVVQMESR